MHSSNGRDREIQSAPLTDTIQYYRSRWWTRPTILHLRNEKLKSDAVDRDITVCSRLQLVTSFPALERHCTAYRRGLWHTCINPRAQLAVQGQFVITIRTQQVPNSNLGQLFDKIWRFNPSKFSGNYTYRQVKVQW